MTSQKLMSRQLITIAAILMVASSTLNAKNPIVEKPAESQTESDATSTLGMTPPKNAVSLFDGSNFDAWKPFSFGQINPKNNQKEIQWKLIDDKAMEIAFEFEGKKRKQFICTKQKFGDYRLHLEFQLPEQGNGNSGIFFGPLYEIQILNSAAKEKPGLTDCGAIYQLRTPDVQAALGPGVWQTVDLEYQSVRLNAYGHMTETGAARVTVRLNGKLIHNDLQLSLRRNKYAAYPEETTSPIVLQDHGSKVKFRNIWIEEENILTAALHKFKANLSKARTPQSSKSQTPDPKKPNIVVILTDDQGYGDLSCFGAKHVSTPRIDQMAAEGSRLTSFYVAAPVCTPSRAGLMTGCYPTRIDMGVGDNFGVLLAGDKKGLNPDEITIAEVMKSAGYKTGMFGKWHLGDQPEFLPTRQGFDEFFGIPYSHDIHPFHPKQAKYKFPALPLLEGETVIEMDPDADFLTKRFTERAVSFIQRNKEEPFFLYVPHPIPHAPVHVSPSFMKGVPDDIVKALSLENGSIDYKTRDKLYRQAIAEIDWSVGQILDTLKANGLDENTFVIFTSDNGPPKNSLHASAGQLRGNKGTTLEGGLREPTVVRWPGKITAGSVNDEIMTAMDLLPTFAELAGATVPTDRRIDGKNIWPTLTGESPTPHEAFFYHRGNSLDAVRSGKWKLHTRKGKPTQLYDLASDIGEKTNVIKSNPDVVKRLNNYLKSFAKDIAHNKRPAGYVETAKPLKMASVNPSTPIPSSTSSRATSSN